MTLKQAAARLGLSPHTLRIQVRSGSLKATRLGTTYVVTGKEVARYEREVKGRHGRVPKAKR